MPIELTSPCKVNLILNILGKRADGFHELETVMHPVPIFDRLSFEKSGAEIELTCSHPNLATDSTNLVHRAAEQFRAAARIRDGVKIHLEKSIPLAAGLGGGSGNAATTLLGLNQLFGQPLSRQDLHHIAASLGSDIPFFLQDQPALTLGRGEKVESLGPLPSLAGVHIMLIHPGFGVSTPWAYKNLARFPAALNGEPGRASRLIQTLRGQPLEKAAPDFYNSLEAPVLEKFPLLVLFQEFLRVHGAAIVLMSGSGSTTFALFASESSAQEALELFRKKFGEFAWVKVAKL